MHPSSPGVCTCRASEPHDLVRDWRQDPIGHHWGNESGLFRGGATQFFTMARRDEKGRHGTGLSREQNLFPGRRTPYSSLALGDLLSRTPPSRPRFRRGCRLPFLSLLPQAHSVAIRGSTKNRAGQGARAAPSPTARHDPRATSSPTAHDGTRATSSPTTRLTRSRTPEARAGAGGAAS